MNHLPPLIPALACLLLLCILTAGCITDTPDPNITPNAEQWTNQEPGTLRTIYLNDDGTGLKLTTETNGKTKTRYFTWEENGPYITLIFTDGIDVDTMTLQNGTLTHDNHIYTTTHEKPHTTKEQTQDTAIIGTWMSDDYGSYTKYLCLYPDGTGKELKHEKNKIKSKNITWKKTGSKYYTLFFETGEDDTLVHTNDTLQRDEYTYKKTDETTLPKTNT